MSLFAVSTTTASRHIRHQLLYNNASSSHLLLRIGGGGNIAAPARCNFATKGLRRPKNSGRPRATTSPTATQSNASSSSSSGGNSSPLQQQQYQRNSDPHSVANEMVNSSTTGRTSGVESVATLTTEQKLSNFAMATGLFGFVSYIFYYSLASVGGVENAKALLFGTSDDKNTQQTEDGAPTTTPGFEEFLKEANEGRTLEEKRIKAETDAKGEARELAALESSTAARLQAEGLGEDSVIVAGSATDEEEREMARVAGFVDGETAAKKKRPLWKRVVFFWRRD